MCGVPELEITSRLWALSLHEPAVYTVKGTDFLLKTLNTKLQSTHWLLEFRISNKPPAVVRRSLINHDGSGTASWQHHQGAAVQTQPAVRELSLVGCQRRRTGTAGQRDRRTEHRNSPPRRALVRPGHRVFNIRRPLTGRFTAPAGQRQGWHCLAGALGGAEHCEQRRVPRAPGPNQRPAPRAPERPRPRLGVTIPGSPA